MRRFDQAQVGRHDITRFESHHIAGHQLAGKHLLRNSVAHDAGIDRSHLAQGGDGALCTVFLNEADGCVENDDDDNGNGIGDITDDARHDRRGDQHHDHEIAELLEQRAKYAALLLLADAVGTVLRKARVCLAGAESGIHVAGQLLRRLFRSQAVPVRRWCAGHFTGGFFRYMTRVDVIRHE